MQHREILRKGEKQLLVFEAIQRLKLGLTSLQSDPEQGDDSFHASTWRLFSLFALLVRERFLERGFFYLELLF